MNNLLPLLILWLISQRDSPFAAPTAPQWPTAASPPPPMPAFLPQPSAPSAAASQHGTPLAQLHAKPPAPTPPARSKASPTHAAQPKAKPRPAAKAARGALRAVKGRVPKPRVPHVARVVSIP